MVDDKLYSRFGFCHRFGVYIIAFLWASGMCFGMLSPIVSEAHVDSLKYLFRNSYVNSFALFCVSFLPFVLTFLSIRFRQFWVIAILAVMKSFISGYWRCIIVLLFADAGWLVNFLIFFTDTFGTVFLLLYWFYGFFRSGKWTVKYLATAMLFHCLLWLLDFCYTGPVINFVI